jgi:hypothetical protein
MTLKFSVLLTAIMVGVFCSNQLLGVDSPKLVFIANVNNGEKIDQVNVYEIVSGDQSNWPDGNPIKLVLPGRKAKIYEFVSRKIFGEPGMMMQRHWLRLVFSGRGNPPQYADSEQEIIDYVLNTPGSAAVVRVSNSDNLGALFLKEL